MHEPIDKFVHLVKEMREAQKLYYKTKKDSPEKKKLLDESRRLEKQTDQEIKKILDPQKKLF